MKLSNIESKQLLPRFAGNISWVMDALDRLIKETAQRVKSIDAPLTMESIEACTDAELEALYDQYGVAKYYPDLSRETRNKMLFEMCRIYRYLGTPKAIEVLCNYIFDGVRLNVKVEDNLAFDENGDLVDESLLDVFDVDVNPTEPIFGADVNARIIANIIRFSRNSQALRSIVYTFIQDFALSVSPCKRTGNPQSTQTWPQDSLCVPYTPPTPAYTEITLYMQSGSKRAQKQVTSGFTGNVNATYCYQLYTDEQLTTPWTGYDYSNEYVIVTAQGIPFSIQKVSDLPDTYTSDSTQWKMAFILMDNGFLWLASNVSGSGYMSYPSEFITVRIYPKGQQWIPAFPYNPSYGKYDNLSINRKGTFVRMGSSATVFGTFPAIAESFGYKSGMIKSASIQAEFLISQATLYLNVVGNPSLSNIVVRFENDICTGYVRSDKADLPTSPSYDGATYTLKDDNGNNIDYDDSFTYKFVLLLNSAGEAVGGTYATGSMIESSTGKLQVRIRYSSSKFNRVWYYRIPIL